MSARLHFSLCEYITVNDVSYLVRVPDSVELEVAAMMPSGAMTAYNAVLAAERQVGQSFHGPMGSLRPHFELCQYRQLAAQGVTLSKLSAKNRACKGT